MRRTKSQKDRVRSNQQARFARVLLLRSSQPTGLLCKVTVKPFLDDSIKKNQDLNVRVLTSYFNLIIT